VAKLKERTEKIPPELEEFHIFLKRAENGDESTLPRLREVMRSPEAVPLFGGDLARKAERALIENAAGKNLPFREALLRKLEMLRDELHGPKPSPVERLLVERVVACWLQVQEADARFAQGTNLSIEWGEYYQRKMDRAHKRYLSAIKTLALVRKLAVPVLQVNVAQKQVNVAGVCPPAV
jgi:hypothetical protein